MYSPPRISQSDWLVRSALRAVTKLTFLPSLRIFPGSKQSTTRKSSATAAWALLIVMLKIMLTAATATSTVNATNRINSSLVCGLS